VLEIKQTTKIFFAEFEVVKEKVEEVGELEELEESEELEN
jgi:hypothetical protein